MSASRDIINNDQRIPFVTVVALALRYKVDSKYLLARRNQGGSGAGCWEFPGGKVEAGETQKQALQREIMEELSFDLTSLNLDFLGKHRYQYGPQHKHNNVEIYLWRAEVDTKFEFILVDHDKTDWFSINEIKDINLSDGDKYFISLL